MRTTRTWTISLPLEMDRIAHDLARREHRTKSKLVREALRRAFRGVRQLHDRLLAASKRLQRRSRRQNTV